MSRNSAGPYQGSSFAFTEARVAAARRAARLEDADDQGRVSWRDDACRGLTLRANLKSGSATYYFVGKQAGRTVRRALGDADVVRLEEARQAVNRLRFDQTVTSVLTPRPTDHDADEADDYPWSLR